MLERVKQGEIGGLQYSVHYSHGSDDWEILFRDEVFPDVSYMTHEQLILTMKLLKANKDKIKQFMALKKELTSTLNTYGYEGKLHDKKIQETEPELLVEQFEEVGVPYHGYRRGKKE